jgi:hypothetical protein
LDRVARLRARYGNLVDDVQQRTEIVNQAKLNLADARASQSAAKSISLLTRYQEPETGDRPLGPGRTKIVAGGLFGGWLIGAGLVFLTLPNAQSRGRRWSDFLPFGRRAADRATASGAVVPAVPGGRRTNDPPTATQSPSEPAREAHGAGDRSPADRRRRSRRAGDR